MASVGLQIPDEPKTVGQDSVRLGWAVGTSRLADLGRRSGKKRSGFAYPLTGVWWWRRGERCPAAGHCSVAWRELYVSDPLKFFTPDSGWTWYVTEGEEEDGDFRFFGFVVGFEKEWGYFVLSELEGARGPCIRLSVGVH